MDMETLLPLGKVDPGLRTPSEPLDIHKVADQSRLVEEIGYSSVMTEETKDDPFTVLTLAANSTESLGIGTAVTITFPRSPTVMALSAWTLQKFSKGRFTLGLGPQVKAHIERRYGIKANPLGPWMRDYVKAVKAVWNTWQNGTKLDYQGKFYNLNLMVPLFDAGPIEHPEIPIHLAAVNEYMCFVAGQVADGVRPHPVCTPSFIEQEMLPQIQAGAKAEGRSLKNFKVSMKPLIATASNEEQLQTKIKDARARIAFYLSTPAYVKAFSHHGLEDLANEAKLLSRAQKWEELPHLISDEILEKFVVIGTFDTIGNKLFERFGNVVTNSEFSIPVNNSGDKEKLTEIIKILQSKSTTAARFNIEGNK